MARATTIEWQTGVVLKLSLENVATALTLVPSTVAIGKSAHTVRQLDITAIKTALSVKVSAIFSRAQEKNRLSFNRASSC